VEEEERHRRTRRGVGSISVEGGHRRTSTWRSKRWRARSNDGRASKADEERAQPVEAVAVMSGGM
jgi:hypothetical protein